MDSTKAVFDGTDIIEEEEPEGSSSGYSSDDRELAEKMVPTGLLDDASPLGIDH